MISGFITGLNKASSLEMLHVLRRLCDNGHLVIATMQSISKKTAQLFDQLVLLNNKEVRDFYNLHDFEFSTLFISFFLNDHFAAVPCFLVLFTQFP